MVFKNLSILLLSSLFILAGCQGGSSTRTIDTSDQVAPEKPGTPDLKSNFFQNNYQTTSNLKLTLDYDEFVFLRGGEVNSYGENHVGEVICLTENFEEAVLVNALRPKKDHNVLNNTAEYKYIFEPSNLNLNKEYCNTPGVNSAVHGLYGDKKIVFKHQDAVLNSKNQTELGAPIKLLTPFGASINDISTSYLRLTVDMVGSDDPSIDNQCTTDESCKTIGDYDCCLNNQCVKNKSLKPNAMLSPDYQRAMEDVKLHPENYTLYPEIFNICANAPSGGGDDDPVAPIIPEDSVQYKGELYDCVNPSIGEMSVCTIKYPKVALGSSEKFFTRKDDRNFQTTYTGNPTLYKPGIKPMPQHSLYEVSYAGVTIYKDRAFQNGFKFKIDGKEENDINIGNDSLDAATYISNIEGTLPSDVTGDELAIKYKVDGSCKKVNNRLAQCVKYYTQGNNVAETNDHYPASNDFLIPQYADISRSVIVEVDGYRKERDIEWELIADTIPYIHFTENRIAVHDTQIVKITYYVTIDPNNLATNVLQSKELALNEIRRLCKCSNSSYCNLKPVNVVQNGVSVVSDYECVYEDPEAKPTETTRTVYVNNRAMPHRLFDKSGTPQVELNDGNEQEGERFEYVIKDNIVQPNNSFKYIGFNEIYGSVTNQFSSAMPAKQIKVEKGHSYDIYTISSKASSCIDCGNDYFSKMVKLFPAASTFADGGGVYPKLQDSISSKALAKYYRADDLLFGRACFVPATMIPWTHNALDSKVGQRRTRLDAQHFLYANGYQRDWYGFDLGALIGSFDGVKWFAIGTERKIKATSDKLFLAINLPFADLTTNISSSVKIVDVTGTHINSSIPQFDYETTGAECRQYHVCNTDADCISTLGWEYMCADVSGMQTSWPKFDQSANEIPATSESVYLINLIDRIDTSKSAKRCVYRGSGAPCHTTYGSTPEYSSYHGTENVKLNACAPNYYCQQFRNENYNPYFNTKINRFNKSVEYKNSVLGTNDHTFGLASPVIGRPEKYNGTETIPTSGDTSITNSFYANNISSICIPGKNLASGAQSFEAQHSKRPDLNDLGDKFGGIGMTPDTQMADHYLTSCGILDYTGNYYYTRKENATMSLTEPRIVSASASQATSTNALGVFLNSLSENTLLKNYNLKQITEPTLETSRCLRLAGSPCFSDQDCGSNSLIAEKLQEVDAEDPLLNSTINKYEIKYWQEPLVCGQYLRKGTPGYDPKYNRCCREVGKTLTIATYQNQPDGSQAISSEMGGVDISINSPNRYTRYSTIYEDVKNGRLRPLAAADDDRCALGSCASTEILKRQYLSFDQAARRTCCGGSWVRNFNKEENGGGHRWGPKKMQSISKDTFKCLNWAPCSDAAGSCGSGFNCAHAPGIEPPECLAVETRETDSKAQNLLEWFSKLELTGIPQIPIEDASAKFLSCLVDYEDQSLVGPNVLKDTIVNGATPEYTNGRQKYLSASDKGNFTDSIKAVFSKDEVTCCIGVGQKLNPGESADICCSGYATKDGRCALPDYANVSVYFNRYVSSEGAGLSEENYDAITGKLKNKSLVYSLACQKKACASGILAKGKVISRLKIPGKEDKETLSRFIDSNLPSSNVEQVADFFDQGLHWNNDYYCFPEIDQDISDEQETQNFGSDAIIYCN